MVASEVGYVAAGLLLMLFCRPLGRYVARFNESHFGIRRSPRIYTVGAVILGASWIAVIVLIHVGVLHWKGSS